MTKTIFLLLSLSAFAATAQNQLGNEPGGNNPVNNIETQVALNTDNNPVQIYQNPPVQYQQVQINQNPPDHYQQFRVRTNPVNDHPQQINTPQQVQQKAGQSIRISSTGGSSGMSSGKAVKKSNKKSMAWKVKKALDRLSDHHRVKKHYSKRGKKHCSRF